MRRLFLQWILCNVLTIAVLYLGGCYFSSKIEHLSFIGIAISLTILLVFGALNTYAGSLSWRIDKLIDKPVPGLRLWSDSLASLSAQAEHVAYAGNECPYIGLIGALSGIAIGLTGDLDPAHIQDVISNSISGIWICFLPTILGVFCRIILSWQHHMIVHRVNLALRGVEQCTPKDGANFQESPQLTHSLG
jgi:hypothetical protein